MFSVMVYAFHLHPGPVPARPVPSSDPRRAELTPRAERAAREEGCSPIVPKLLCRRRGPGSQVGTGSSGGRAGLRGFLGRCGHPGPPGRDRRSRRPGISPGLRAGAEGKTRPRPRRTLESGHSTRGLVHGPRCVLAPVGTGVCVRPPTRREVKSLSLSRSRRTFRRRSSYDIRTSVLPLYVARAPSVLPLQGRRVVGVSAQVGRTEGGRPVSFLGRGDRGVRAPDVPGDPPLFHFHTGSGRPMPP